MRGVRKSHRGKSVKKTSPRRKSVKRKSPRRKSPRRKSVKRKSLRKSRKRKSTRNKKGGAIRLPSEYFGKMSNRYFNNVKHTNSFPKGKKSYKSTP